MLRRCAKFLLIVAAFLAGARSLSAQAPSPDGLDFFERKIRPVLAERCLKCHSEQAASQGDLKGGFRLDSRDGLLAGGDSGPAIVPGKPDESLLMEAVRYEGLEMPPDGRLPDSVIDDLSAWIAQGAPDPRLGSIAVRPAGLSVDEGKSFWSYRPVANPGLPQVQRADWPADDLDRFILAGLEEKGLFPAGDADRLTLVRRVTFDLVGLPPTPEEADAFINDLDPGAFERLVDRLLASPGFGDRWGRHWLDVARFAESMTLRGFVFPEAWRYRDYVVDSFNADRPFDRFIREQIAGDLLPAESLDDRQRQLTATTFLVLGNTNLEEQDKKQLRMDVVDEMLDVICKGFLAQTVTCARCHDHKFDPIPTRDYYALAGILRNAKALEHANVSKWIEVRLPLSAELEAVHERHEAEVAALETRLKDAKALASASGLKTGALAVADLPGIVIDDVDAKKVGQWKDSTYNPTFIGTGYTHDLAEGKGQKTITFQTDVPETGRYEVRFAWSPGSNRDKAVPVTVFSADGEKTLTIDMTQAPPIDGRFASLGEYKFEKDGQSFVIVSNEGTMAHVTADAVVFLPESAVASAAPSDPKDAPAATQARKADDEVKSLEAEIKRQKASGPKRPMVMSIVDEETIEDARVHIRGQVATQGDVVPRGFLQVITTGAEQPIPPDHGGRAELAAWIASRDNPLTSRVIVNRTWHWLFGSGLVRTVDNFGTTGEKPSHPELLDHLALRFVEQGWSMKRLVRTIVMSRTYRQASDLSADRPEWTADPENRLFGRANRRRLDAEAIRDAMLAAGGNLDPARGGPTFPTDLSADYGYQPASLRRSVYVPVFRNALPELFEVFDFADPSVVTGARNQSTVAPQALYLLNNPFPIEQARLAARRVLLDAAGHEARLDRLYRIILGRPPWPAEKSAALAYLASSDSGDDAWPAVAQALFASPDFRWLH
jgi:hypothetical protein